MSTIFLIVLAIAIVLIFAAFFIPNDPLVTAAIENLRVEIDRNQKKFAKRAYIGFAIFVPCTLLLTYFLICLFS